MQKSLINNKNINTLVIAVAAFTSALYSIFASNFSLFIDVLIYSAWAKYCTDYLNPDLDIRSSFLGPMFDGGEQLSGYRAGYREAPFKYIVEFLFFLSGQNDSKANKAPKSYGFVQTVQSLFIKLALGAKKLNSWLNVLHNLIFSPLGYLFTHRGFIHWFGFGTIFKALYITAPFWILGFTSISDILTSPWFVIWALSDSMHIVGDFIEDIKNDRVAFVPHPNKAPRGILQTIASLLIPTKIKLWWGKTWFWNKTII
jgi:hypothetical protein